MFKCFKYMVNITLSRNCNFGQTTSQTASMQKELCHIIGYTAMAGYLVICSLLKMSKKTIKYKQLDNYIHIEKYACCNSEIYISFI